MARGIVKLCVALTGAVSIGGAFAGLAASNSLGLPAPESRASFEVALPLRNVDELESLLTALHDPENAQYHHWLTPAEFATRFGPEPAMVAQLVSALKTRGLAVTTHTRSLHVVGPAALVESALGTHLHLAATTTGALGSRLVAQTAPQLTEELSTPGATVMSYNGHEAHTMSRKVAEPKSSGIYNRYSQDGGYWFTDLKQAYQYPSYDTFVPVNGKARRLDGTGATIGVLMSSDYLPSDVAAVFHHEKWVSNTGKSVPKLYKDVAINGGGGLFGPAFAEVSIDTQSEITGAPGAHVILYNIPDLSDENIFAGYVEVIESNEVDVLSMSFGGCELDYFPERNGGTDARGILRAYHELFMQGNAQGITFLASSGDEAGLECASVPYYNGKSGKFVSSVSTPANDPNVTAVGGTNLVTAYEPGSLESPYATENAWSDPEIPYDYYGFGKNVSGGFWGAGGGESTLFAAPSYQKLVDTTFKGRALPDIGMHVGGCPGGISIVDKKTGVCNGGDSPKNGYGNTDRSYGIFAVALGHDGGGYEGYIGTSLSSPQFAGVLALLIEQKGRLGNANPYLYSLAAKQAKDKKPLEYLHTGIPGYNGVIESNVSATYNVSTGVGTPIVKALVGAPTAASAGTPQSASNP